MTLAVGRAPLNDNTMTGRLTLKGIIIFYAVLRKVCSMIMIDGCAKTLCNLHQSTMPTSRSGKFKYDIFVQ